MPDGSPAHTVTKAQYRAPILGAPTPAALHANIRKIWHTPNPTEIDHSLRISERYTIGEPVFSKTAVYNPTVLTDENNDGTLTNVICQDQIPGTIPGSSPTAIPDAFQFCINLAYKDANPATAQAWVSAAFAKIRTTTVGFGPQESIANLNCLHWQLSWNNYGINPGYNGDLTLQVTTGFVSLTEDKPDRADFNATKYGC